MSDIIAANKQAIFTHKEVAQVNLPAVSGELGVLANHVPFVEELAPGVVEVIESSGTTSKYFISGGFASILPGSKLNVSTVEVFPLDAFSSESIKTQLAEANKNASSADESVAAEAAVEIELANTCDRAAASPNVVAAASFTSCNGSVSLSSFTSSGLSSFSAVLSSSTLLARAAAAWAASESTNVVKNANVDMIGLSFGEKDRFGTYFKGPRSSLFFSRNSSSIGNCKNRRIHCSGVLLPTCSAILYHSFGNCFTPSTSFSKSVSDQPLLISGFIILRLFTESPFELSSEPLDLSSSFNLVRSGSSTGGL
ncbi:hypothetical protein OGAPHI_000602 [Ogataea philodendri]|uniref:ATP synthase subunit delta, mitochondrial n=1 Tax=Ogataea philodendri TaxID=1378263 RepID=A0A9P8T9I1_9ASCO|nr:uncharacterized protein OGAPHI_000602 [Ogataea philodendri]KAH3670891.1 hypothetical protein OGAPHI_000602 [Ogataea philodendri]